MGDTATTGAWGGSLERKQAVVGAVSAAIADNKFAWPSATLGLNRPDNGPRSGNGYCVAFDTDDASELERRSGLPVDVLLMLGAGLTGTVFLGWTGTPTPGHIVPSTENGLVHALEAVRPGANLEALRPLYVVALLRALRDLVPPDGVDDMPPPQLIERIANLHLEALASRAADASTWSVVRREAVAATDAARTQLSQRVASFVESVAWPLEDLAVELPGVVEMLHLDICNWFVEALRTPEQQACFDRYLQASKEIREEQMRLGAVADDAWFQARLEESPAVQVISSPDFQRQLIALGHAAYDRHGPRAYRLLMDTLNRL